MKFKINHIWILLGMIFSLTSSQNLIESIEFLGNKRFNDKTLMKWGGLKEGAAWRYEDIGLINKKIINELNKKGYLYASIDSVIIKSSVVSNNVSILWYIKEDMPFRIGEIIIETDSVYVESIKEDLDLRSGDLYVQESVESELSRINKFFANQGYPFSQINISNITIRKEKKYYQVDLYIDIDLKEHVSIDEIFIRGNKFTHSKVILREISVKAGDPYNQKKIDQISQQLNHLGFFTSVINPVLVYQKNGKTALILEVEEGNNTTFDGVIGYIPEEQSSGNQEGYFNGLIQIYFRNLFGTGRRFEVNWKKSDRYSEEFRLYYEEPWIFNFPVNIGLGLERIVRDTTYLEQSYFINGSIRLSSSFKTTFSLSQNSIVPDSTMSRNLRLARNKIVSTSIGIDYDTRDYPVNPRRGVLYRTSYSYGLKKNTGPDYLLKEDQLPENEEIQKIKIKLAYFLSVTRNQVLYLNIQGETVKGNKNRLQLSDHIWFGGARSLRGYRENQFHGTTISWCNLEYRFILGRTSRLFVFNDLGFYTLNNNIKFNEKVLYGYGVGIRFDTPLGILGIDYGLGKDDTFSTAKVHFGIINTF